MDTVWTVATVVLGFEVVILFHLLGHFLAAKLFGVPVEIRLGLGPAIPGCRFGRARTTWVLAFFPLGGYYKVPLPSNTDGAVPPIWKRLFVAGGGVVVNVLLAWICFSLWLYHGAERIAPVIARVDAGSPAWIKGLPSGAVIHQIGAVSTPSFNDVIVQVMSTLPNETLEVAYSVPGRLDKTSVKIIPRFDPNSARPVLGIQPSSSPRLVSKRTLSGEPSAPVLPKSAASRAEPPFAFNDVIIGTSDPDNPDRIKPLPQDPRDPASGSRDYFEYARRLRLLAGKDIRLQVRRADGRQENIRVPAAFHVTIGARMETGPITAVRDASPGTDAGVQPPDPARRLDGDVIVAVEVKEPDGHATTFDEGNLDPLRLPYQLRQWSRRMAEAKKGDERIVTLKVHRHQAFAEGPQRRRLVNVPLRWDSSWENQYDEPLSRTSPAAIPELGIAYQVRSKIAGVDNGQGLQTGDIILALESSNPKTGVAVDPDGWAWAFAALQRMQNKDMTVEVLRDGQRVKLALNVMEDGTWPLEDRGLLLAQDTRIQKSDNLLDTFGLGLAQLSQEISQVVANVRNLLVGSIAPENLGGPTTVAQVGYRIAEFDLFSFIGFMGIMSFNFSLFNLWPIPLLDGGEALLLLVEKAKGGPLPPVARFIAYTIGLLLLSSCLLANLALDLMR